jgi:hypothetical protein
VDPECTHVKISFRGFFSFRFSIVLPRLAKARGVPENASYELDRFRIAGFQYHQGPFILDELRPGDELELVREATNPHDHRAVALYRGKAHMGYVPRSRNRPVARLLDQECALLCRITAVDPDAEPWNAVAVSILVLGPSRLPALAATKSWPLDDELA